MKKLKFILLLSIICITNIYAQEFSYKKVEDKDIDKSEVIVEPGTYIISVKVDGAEKYDLFIGAKLISTLTKKTTQTPVAFEAGDILKIFKQNDNKKPLKVFKCSVKVETDPKNIPLGFFIKDVDADKQISPDGITRPPGTYTIIIKGNNDGVYSIKINESEKGELKNDKVQHTIKDGDVLTITKKGDDKILAKINCKSQNVAVAKPIEPSPSIFIANKYKGKLINTEKGLKLNSEDGLTYSGDDYIHIFLDGAGNSVLTTTPQGIPYTQYVIHLVYLTKEKDPKQIMYSVSLKAGFIQEQLFILGGNVGIPSSKGEDQKPAPDQLKWAEEITVLRKANVDIEFDIIRSTLKQDGADVTQESKTVSSHKIIMAKPYNVAINVGLLNSNLSNPEYVLSNLPSDPTKKTVAEKQVGNSGIATIMVILYSSPVILIEKFFGLRKDIPEYQTSARCFQDDHQWYEKIYPCIGVKLTDKVFENLFFGLNLEIARGGSFFIGAHYGKVNTFKDKDLFKFGKDVITEDEYNIRKDTEWKVNWAFGANIDLAIFGNFFK